VFFENGTHFFMLDPDALTVTLISDLRRWGIRPRWGASMACLDADHLVLLEGNGSRRAWLYTISADEWSRLPDLPEKLSEYSCAVGDCAGRVYVVVGGRSSGFYAYDAGLATWVKLSDAPAALVTGLAYHDGRIYMTDAGGGIHEYVVEADAWYPLTPKLPVYSLKFGDRLECDCRNLYYVRMDYTSETLYAPLIYLSKAGERG